MRLVRVGGSRAKEQRSWGLMRFLSSQIRLEEKPALSSKGSKVKLISTFFLKPIQIGFSVTFKRGLLLLVMLSPFYRFGLDSRFM